VVTKRDLGRPHLIGKTVKHAAPQSRTQRTWRRTGVEHVVDDLPDRRVLNMEFPSPTPAGLLDEVVPEILVAGVDRHRDKGEIYRCPASEFVERLHQCPAVFSTG